MVAIIGIPGSQHHKWEHAENTRGGRQWAREWLQARFDAIRANYPHDNPPRELISDAEARRRRYQDGRRIYDV